jgi:hypothetical protein
MAGIQGRDPLRLPGLVDRVLRSRKDCEMEVVWRAVGREAGVAAEHLAIGATAITRANYAEPAYYGQALFALSTGIERATKLAIAIDHAIDNGGAFPDQKDLRKYGHDLQKLLAASERIAEDRGLEKSAGKLPDSPIHEGIVETLSDFASNVTRYYNLEILTRQTGTDGTADDPVATWYRRVTEPTIEKHLKRRSRERIEANARKVEAMMGSRSITRHTTETGELIDSVYEASKRSGETSFARPWERMYVLQIARFLGRVLEGVGSAAQQQSLPVPYLGEFFVIFLNDDKYLRERRTWSIYSQ